MPNPGPGKDRDGPWSCRQACRHSGLGGRREAEDRAGSEAKHFGNGALGAMHGCKSQNTMNLHRGFSRPEKTELGTTDKLKLPGRS